MPVRFANSLMKACSGNQSQVIQRGRTQFPGKPMNHVHRLLHQKLRPFDLFLELLWVARCFPGQGRQVDIDAHQALGDFIMQLAADSFSFLLLRVQNLMGKLAQLLHQTRLVVLAPPQGSLHRVTAANFLLQLPVGSGEHLDPALRCLGAFAFGDVVEKANHAILAGGQGDALNLPFVSFLHPGILAPFDKLGRPIRPPSLQGVPETMDDLIGDPPRPKDVEDFRKIPVH
jgi:hypothetical protein